MSRESGRGRGSGGGRTGRCERDIGDEDWGEDEDRGEDEEGLRARLSELETAVDALTGEIVEIQQRLDEMEGRERDEVGVGYDPESEEEDTDGEDDIYVA